MPTFDKADSNLIDNKIEESAAFRRALAFGEGLGYAVPGAVKAVVHDVSHPVELLEKGAVAASIGVGLRVLLPQSGAGKAIVSAVMGYYMVRDAAQPLLKGWEDAGKAKNIDEVHSAARGIGDGLGAFAWDSYFGAKIGLRAEKLTGSALNAGLGQARYAQFEKLKIDLDAKYISAPTQFVLAPLARASNWTSDKLAERALARQKAAEGDIDLEQIKTKLKFSHDQHPHTVAAVDISQIADLRTPTGLELSGKRTYSNKAEREVNVANYSKLADMNRDAMKAWTNERILVEDAKEKWVGPVHAAITPSYKTMDPGYILPRNQMMRIASQIKTEEDLKAVLPNFSRFSMAAVQHISAGLSATASLKYQMDLVARETHTALVRNMVKAGINPDNVLRSKNPALFSISHDGGYGPHTIKQVDQAWNLDHVLYPRQMIDTRSVTASGIYQHELGHDQYGGILKFDQSIRDEVINRAITRGLGSRANEQIFVPDHGYMSKQKLIEAIYKAQAEENTADIWGAAWTGHNTGGALGVLLQSVRGGVLDNFGQTAAKFKGPDNPFGFQLHAIDAMRPKIVAATMRARANGDTRVLDYADALDRYAAEASGPGDYVFRNMDNPAKTITVPRKDMEDVIPHLIDAQLHTPLTALQGRTFADILPDLPQNLAKMDNLADLIVDAVVKNKKPAEIPFDVSQYSIIQVFGAGLPAASRLVSPEIGMDAVQANTAVNKMSDYLRALYQDHDPHVDPLKVSVRHTVPLTSPRSFRATTSQFADDLALSTSQVLTRSRGLNDWLGQRAVPISAASASATIGAGVEKRKDN
ncbi:MAG: hypothetical protein JSS83_19940 [Cyanobacteria bacterium SZAS LIN-3]|nr:hypothetical protein [Cyanobacteria bacterium SZAS LIN-3]MBS2009267.1 hypothetical protein [Cyanobacteria bacterium SZAS TMP-1]